MSWFTDIQKRVFRGRLLSRTSMFCWIATLTVFSLPLIYKDIFFEVLEEITQQGYAPAVLIFSAILAFIGAMFSAYLSRKTAKDRATMQYLMGHHRDEDLLQKQKLLMQISKTNSGEKIVDIYDKDHYNDKRIAIKVVLSHFEDLATAVNNHMYNEKMLMDSSISKIAHLYNTCEPYIRKVRENDQSTAYCEFREMALRWKPERDRRHKSN